MHRLAVKRIGALLNICLALALTLSACQRAPAPTADADGIAAALARQSAAATDAAVSAQPVDSTTSAPAPTFAPTAARPARALWIPKYLPEKMTESLNLPADWTAADDEASASLRFDVLTDRAAGPAPDAVAWVYALVAPFPTVQDDEALSELQLVWKASATDILPLKGLLVDESTRAVFEQAWGKAGAVVTTLPTEKIQDAAWADKDVWAIVPFEQLNPRWKVLSVDGQSPVRKDFALESYSLTVRFAPQGDAALRSIMAGGGPLAASNRQPDHLTTVMITGVTALVRGTASLMEGRGLDYPAQDIGDWLREADILHVSNEVAFAKNCPAPFDWVDLRFCSRPKYIKLLEDVGVDVVELTGDHLSDWGPDAVLNTLDMYKERGWPTYGGGANIAEARKPALLEHNGSKFAFLGCNAKAKGYAAASETTPGAVHCDMDDMVTRIQQAKADGYIPIVTFQHLEYYQYTAHPILQADFRKMADAGAVIISGSQAHQPHAFEFDQGAFLHYGLGNLFFDQTNQGDAPRTAFIDRHVFYEGKHISTELLTIYLVDYARSRPMTAEERRAMLETVFKASGW